jgi:hypothetical protein
MNWRNALRRSSMLESPSDMVARSPEKRMRSPRNQIVVPIIGGAVVAALTALLFWLIDRFLI